MLQISFESNHRDISSMQLMQKLKAKCMAVTRFSIVIQIIMFNAFILGSTYFVKTTPWKRNNKKKEIYLKNVRKTVFSFIVFDCNIIKLRCLTISTVFFHIKCTQICSWFLQTALISWLHKMMRLVFKILFLSKYEIF